MVDVANFAARNFGGGPDLANIDLQRTRNALGQLQLNQETAMGPLRQQALQQAIDTGQANENRINQESAARTNADNIHWLAAGSRYVKQHPEAWPSFVGEAKKRGVIPQEFNQEYDPQKIDQFLQQYDVMSAGLPQKLTPVSPGQTLLDENQRPVYTAPENPGAVDWVPSGDQLVPKYHNTGQAPPGLQPMAGKQSQFSSGGEITPDVVNGYRDQILAGNGTLQNVPLNVRNQVTVALNSTGKEQYSPMASSRMTLAASRITHPFTNMSAYKLTADGKPYLERIDAALKNPGSVSDQDLLDSLTKLNTGGNAVTDAQVRLITDGKSFSDAAQVFANKFKSGGVLSPDQRGQIKAIANQIYENYKKGYQPIYNQAAKQLTDAGIPKQFWTIPDLNNLNGDSAQAAPSSSGGWTIKQISP